MRTIFLKSVRRLARNKSGSSAVEFALFAPFLISSFFFTADYGMLTFDKLKVDSATRTGAQYVMAGGRDETAISAAITSALGEGMELSSLTVSQTCECSGQADIEVACNVPCNDDGDEPPTSITSINASYVTQRFIKTHTLTSSLEIRTR